MIIDALLHRYGGNLSFLEDWTWTEAVRHIRRMMELIEQEEKRLRWYLRYEDQYPEYRAFDKATTPIHQPIRSVKDICDDCRQLMDLTWKEAGDGQWD